MATPKKNKTGGTTGSNQYGPKGTAKPTTPTLVAPRAGAEGLLSQASVGPTAEAQTTPEAVRRDLEKANASRRWKKKIEAGLSEDEKRALVEALCGSHSSTSEWSSAGATASGTICRQLLSCTPMRQEEINKLKNATRQQVRVAVLLSDHVTTEEVVKSLESSHNKTYKGRESSHTLARVLATKDPYRALEYANNPAASHREEIIENLAESPTTPAAILDKLQELEPRRVAANKNASPESLERLSRSTKEALRSSVAANPSAPPQVLDQLAEDPEEWVRRGVAQNPRTPPQTLARLAEDQDGLVRWRVAENPRTPPNILTSLIGDPSRSIRLAALKNPRLPQHLRALAGLLDT